MRSTFWWVAEGIFAKETQYQSSYRTTVIMSTGTDIQTEVCNPGAN